MHYSERNTKFIKVFMQLYKQVTHLRMHVEKGIAFNGSTFWTTTYESNLPNSLRFMIDNQMVGMSWVDIKAGTYGIRSKGQKKTTS
jgi:DNA polymerase elongation subunit (family B)